MTPNAIDQYQAGLIAVVGIAADMVDQRGVAAIIERMPRHLGLSFVVLPGRPGSEDALAHDLLKSFGRPAHRAESGAVLEADHVYLAPSGSEVLVEQSSLRLSRASGGPEAIDSFLSSLATDQSARSVGVVLSNEQHHGRIGLQAIERAGGCSLGPLSWEGASMSASLTAVPLESIVHQIPERIIQHLARLRTGEFDKGQQPASPARSGEHPRIARNQSPKVLTSGRHGEGLALNLEMASRRFFPDEQAWVRLADHLDALLDSRRFPFVRAWAPACGTGQRAYALAMLLSERRSSGGQHQVQVFGSDPDAVALGIARAGRYPRSAIEGLPRERRRRFFMELDDSVQVTQALRHSVLFACQDIFSAPALSRIDLLYAGDLLNTCPSELLPRLFGQFHFSLRHGGLLFVERAAASLVPNGWFEPIDPECGLFRARPTKSLASRHNSSAQPSASNAELQALTAELRGLSAQRFDELDRLDRARADLENFVEATEVLACICDSTLRITRSSTALAREFGLGGVEPKTPLEDLAGALPGAASLVRLARAVVRTGKAEQRMEHVDGTPPRSYLVRLLPYRNYRGAIDGVVVVFTDVSALEQARALAARRELQQAAVAALGLAALSLPPNNLSAAPVDLYQQALGSIAATLGCERGAVLEVGHGADALLVRAARAWSGVPADSQLIPMRAGGVLAQGLSAKGTLALNQLGAESALEPLFSGCTATGGIVCPLRVDETVYGLLVTCSEQPDELTPEDLHFVQAVANVLAGALGRQRARRRLSLEREVGMVVAEADDIPTLAAGIDAALATTMGTTNLQLWMTEGPARKSPLRRVWPAQSDDSIAGSVPSRQTAEKLAASKQASFTLQQVAGRAKTEIAFPVLGGKSARGFVVCYSEEPIANDEELLLGLERVGRAIGDFLHWTRMNQALHESEQRYRAQSAELEAIYATLPVGLAIHDQELRPIRINQQLAELKVGTYADPVPAQAALRSVLASGESVRDVEVTTESERGPRSLLCSFAPLKDSEGRAVAVSSVVQDITERKSMEQALRDADRQKDEFLAMLGHELRNPLAAIRNASELMGLLGAKEPELARLQGVLDRQSRHMAKLIDGLLDVSRIMRGKLVLDQKIVDLRRLLQDVVQDRTADLQRQKLVLHLEVPKIPLWVECDPVRLVQIFDNILSNASKFTESGGVISLKAAAARGAVEVVIEDNGIGIEPALLPYIFEPFRQAAQTADRSLGGLGLGLSLVRGLVELHGGTVRAESPGAGHGARFVVELPASREAGRPPTIPPPKVTCLRVLIVEDNLDMAETLAELLNLSGHQVVALAGSGSEGIEQALAQKPDVVLCDLGLPGDKDGFDVARAVHSNASFRAVLIAVTGYGDSGHRKRAREAGFDECLVKPVTLEVLQQHLRRAARQLAEQPNTQLS